jgi:hypothetical protein
MRSDSQVEVLVPRTAALVASRLEDLAGVYLIARGPDRGPLDALMVAVKEVFHGGERREVVAFLQGRRDSSFGAGAGDRLAIDLVTSFEDAYRGTVGLTQ